MSDRPAWVRAFLLAACAPLAALFVFALLALYTNLAYPGDPGSGYVLYYALILLAPMTILSMVAFGTIGCMRFRRARKTPALPDQIDAAPIQGERRSLRFAGFWRRLMAGVIDGLAILLVSFCFFYLLSRIGFINAPDTSNAEGLLFDTLISVASAMLPWVYFTFFESSALQGTFGKRLFGLIVTDLRGAPISWARANARFWAKGLTLMTFLVGFFICSVTLRKQALHDAVSGCVVCRRRNA